MRQSWVRPSLSLPSTSNRNISSGAAEYLLENGLREAAPMKVLRNGDFACHFWGSAMILGAMGAVLTFIAVKGMDKYIRCSQTSPLDCAVTQSWNLSHGRRRQLQYSTCASCCIDTSLSSYNTDTTNLHGCRGQMISFLEIMTASAGLHLHILATISDAKGGLLQSSVLVPLW